MAFIEMIKHIMEKSVCANHPVKVGLKSLTPLFSCVQKSTCKIKRLEINNFIKKRHFLKVAETTSVTKT